MKVEPSKKRPAESAAKTPATDKKAKATPQRTGDLSCPLFTIYYSCLQKDYTLH